MISLIKVMMIEISLSEIKLNKMLSLLMTTIMILIHSPILTATLVEINLLKKHKEPFVPSVEIHFT